MPHRSVNPATGEILAEYPCLDEAGLLSGFAQLRGLDRAKDRRRLFALLAQRLREECDRHASLLTIEMGKPIGEARAEVRKCATLCEYYSERDFLTPLQVETDASSSHVEYLPLGVVLGIMPWNFPYWQVFRAAVPALCAGNAFALKHAPNVPQCALEIERLFRECGFPFSTFLIETDLAERAISLSDAVTFTGSETAGRKVAAVAGSHLRKCVLELGGSDPFIVLHDADIEAAADAAVASRFMNCGQSCIAAKRIILVSGIEEEFLSRFREGVGALRMGDPMQEECSIGPMARADLRDLLHAQVQDAIERGSVAVTGCEPVSGPGFHYRPSILDRVPPDARVLREEVFGPVAVLLHARDEEDAVRLANDTRYGLGASVWSRDIDRAQHLGRRIEAGSVFVNAMVKSDPRLPFGGVKASGFGRELSFFGVQEFVNVKTVWVK